LRSGCTGAIQLRESLLDAAQLADQRIVVGIGELRAIEDVVEIIVMRDRGAQLLDPARRITSARLHRRAHRRSNRR